MLNDNRRLQHDAVSFGYVNFFHGNRIDIRNLDYHFSFGKSVQRLVKIHDHMYYKAAGPLYLCCAFEMFHLEPESWNFLPETWRFQ